jgi:cell division protein FtsB
MSTTDELVFNLRDQHDMLGPIALEAADAIETLTRERDEAREACAMNNDTHSRISADYTQTIRALEARITKLEADKARLRDDMISIEEYWNRSRTDVAMIDALEYITATAREALDATS